MLFIVARDQPDLYEALRREFSKDTEIQVVLDRRREPEPGEAVSAERRVRNDVESQLRSLGWAFVRSDRVPRPRDAAADRR